MFLAVDPQGQFASPYLAFGNNPVLLVDPDGEFAWVAAGFVLYNAIMSGIKANKSGGRFIDGFMINLMVGTIATVATAGIGAIGNGIIGTAEGLGAGLARLGVQAVATTSGSVASNLMAKQPAFSNLNIGIGPFTLPIRDGKISKSPLDHISNIFVGYRYSRSFIDVAKGNVTVSFDKNTISPVFKVKEGKSGFVSKMLKNNPGTAYANAIYVNSDSKIEAHFAEYDNLYIKYDPDFWSDESLRVKARGAQALKNSSDKGYAVQLHEGVHIIQQRLVGGPFYSNLVYSLFSNGNYYLNPFERQAFYITYKITKK